MKRRAISYTEDELAWIKARSKNNRRRTHAKFCAVFGRDDVTLFNFNSLCKRKGWFTGRTGRYEKGAVPLNKGKKMPYNENSAKTRFKKGNVPHTFRGAGHETTCPKDGYTYIIVDERHPQTGAPTRRVLKHKWLWEKMNGRIPAGKCLKCLDGDKSNCDPSNWKLIDRALLPRLNNRWGRNYEDAEPEVRPTLLTMAELEHKAKTLKDEKSNA